MDQLRSPSSHGIRTLPPSGYPKTLSNARNPPPSLTMRGSLSADPDERYLCVVGSRMCTPYGRDSVRDIILGLRGYPISIVSGLAVGIDGLSHEAALEAGLRCVAFPGSTLDWSAIYPPSQTGLARRIVDRGGALLSLWEPGYPTGAWSFAARNVLMAAISHAILIIEAAKGSGSLLTAAYAENDGRTVMAVPGPIGSSLSYGPHMLLRRGAALIRSSDDVLEELGFEPQRGPGKRRRAIHALSPELRSIFDAVSREAMSPDRIAEKTRLPLRDVIRGLTVLETAGIIVGSLDGYRAA